MEAFLCARSSHFAHDGEVRYFQRHASCVGSSRTGGIGEADARGDHMSIGENTEVEADEECVDPFDDDEIIEGVCDLENPVSCEACGG